MAAGSAEVPERHRPERAIRLGENPDRRAQANARSSTPGFVSRVALDRDEPRSAHFLDCLLRAVSHRCGELRTRPTLALLGLTLPACNGLNSTPMDAELDEILQARADGRRLAEGGTNQKRAGTVAQPWSVGA